jgi:hypothetical protein
VGGRLKQHKLCGKKAGRGKGDNEYFSETEKTGFEECQIAPEVNI